MKNNIDIQNNYISNHNYSKNNNISNKKFDISDYLIDDYLENSIKNCNLVDDFINLSCKKNNNKDNNIDSLYKTSNFRENTFDNMNSNLEKSNEYNKYIDFTKNNNIKNRSIINDNVNENIYDLKIISHSDKNYNIDNLININSNIDSNNNNNDNSNDNGDNNNNNDDNNNDDCDNNNINNNYNNNFGCIGYYINKDEEECYSPVKINFSSHTFSPRRYLNNKYTDLDKNENIEINCTNNNIDYCEENIDNSYYNDSEQYNCLINRKKIYSNKFFFNSKNNNNINSHIHDPCNEYYCPNLLDDLFYENETICYNDDNYDYEDDIFNFDKFTVFFSTLLITGSSFISLLI